MSDQSGMSHDAPLLTYVTRRDLEQRERERDFEDWWFRHFRFAPSSYTVIVREGSV